MQNDSRQAGTIETFRGHGIFVPLGMTLTEIVEITEMLESQFGVAGPHSQRMAVAMLDCLIRVREGAGGTLVARR